MSRRVLARPLAAATLAGALVLTPALATADPGNGQGGGQEQAPGQQKDKAGQDNAQKDKSQDAKAETGKGGGKAEAPGQQKEPGQPATGKGQGGNGYLTMFPNGTSRPAISALTWLYPNDRLSTLAIAIPGNGNIVNVYASLGCDVFFDVVGLLVPSPASVADAHLAPGAVTSNVERAEKLRKQHAARF